MGKEVKIGLAVIAVLLSVFGGVLYMRLRGGDTTSTAAAKESIAKDKDGIQVKDKKKSKTKLSSGPDAAKVASNHRSDRYSWSSKKRPGKLEATIDDGGDADVGSESLTDGQGDMTVNDSEPRSDQRYGNRDRDRYGTANESLTDDSDDPSGVATIDDSIASDSDVDEPESTEPPSELGPADAEAPLSPDDRDESIVEPVGGNADALDIEGETYTVRPNDNYWTISQRVYGTGSYFKALQEFNRDQYPNPDRLDVGDAVSVPDVAVLEESYPKLCPKRRHVAAQQRMATLASSRPRGASGEGAIYTVAEGDTLFDIARRQLGSAERWAEIHDLNRDQLGDEIHYLSPGTRLTLPGGNRPADRPKERVTTRPRRAASRR